MTSNKKVVEEYFGSKGTEYSRLLADDIELIEWADDVPPTGIRTRGKEAYVKNRGTREFETHISRMTEENNVVIAEGVARGAKKEGGHWRVQFVDIFELEHGKVKRLIAFGTPTKDAE